MRHLLALAMSLLLAAGGLAVLAPPALAYTPDNEELTFLALINDYRGQNGLTALSINPALGDAARFHSQDMAENNYFEHTALDGTGPDQNVKNFGYTGSTTGENIAAGMETASEVLSSWQASPEHNAGMLNPAFGEIGIGRYYNANSAYGWYWTTTFGGGSLPGGATETTGDGAPAPDGNGNGDGNGNNNGHGNGNGNGNRDQNGDGGTNTVIAEPGANITTDISDDGTESTNVENGNGEVLESQQEAPSGPLNADGSTVSANDDGTGTAVGDGEMTVYDDINTGGVSGDSVNYDQSVTPPTTETAPPPADPAAAPPADTAAAPPADAAAAPPADAAAAPPADTAAAPPADPAAVPPAGQTGPVEGQTVTTTENNGTVTDTYSETIEEGAGNTQALGNDSNTSSSGDPGAVTTDGTTDTADPALAAAPPAETAAAPEAAPAAAPVASGPPEGVYLDPAQAGLGCWDYTDWYDAQLAYENGGGLAADPAFVNSMDPNWDGVACEDLMVY